MNINNRLIAKNTMALYVRMFVLMAVNLYVSRVVLNLLGVEDFGIYNVVGSFVLMFSIISRSLTSAVQRFLNFYLGKGNQAELRRVFATSLMVQILISVLIVVVVEVVGLWYLFNKMNLPADRVWAAVWVFQASLLAFVINLLNVPYNAAIIAHERMSAFAVVSLVEAALRLAAVYALYVTPVDKLVTYAVLIALVTLITRAIYVVYCHSKFSECKFKLIYDKKLFKEMGAFAGWNFLENAAWVLNNQGIMVLINAFFNVVVNAAQGIAYQVYNAMKQFVDSFMSAMKPQITKTYAAQDYEASYGLACKASRLSCFLLWLLALPILLETDELMLLWLKNVPEYTVEFVRWLIATILAIVVSEPLLTLVLASGKIRACQLTSSLVQCGAFFGAALAFWMGSSPLVFYVLFLLVFIVLVFVRLYFAHTKAGFPVGPFMSGVLVRVLVVMLISAIVPLAIHLACPQSFLRTVLVTATTLFSSGITFYLFGFEQNEKNYLVNCLKNFAGKFLKKS